MSDKPLGRPTLYKKEYDNIVYHLAKDGKTENEIAVVLDVSIDTITEWKNVHENFSASLKKGRAEHDDGMVVNSLLKRAKGFRRKIQKLDKDGNVVELEEEVPPDATSMIFWLKNRQSKYWRDRQDIEHSGNLNITPVFNINLKK